MSTPPQAEFSSDHQPCLSFSNNCGDQSATALRIQVGRNHELDRTEMKETEDLLAGEMSKLSFQERSKALDDVHCLGEEMQETPELLEQSLREFDRIVRSSNNAIYNKALAQNRSYVEDPSFRLKFIRANRFDARKAVNQMFFFLRQKAMYFGEEKVARDILPEEMSREEIALMQSGYLQVVKDRDRSGRIILYASPFSRVSSECKIETRIYVIYHIIINTVITIPSAQTKGIVLIYYDESNGEKIQLPKFTERMKVVNFLSSLPIRISSLHLCFYSSPGSLSLHNKVFQAFLKTRSEHALTRTRIHYGSDMERQYQLRPFGIHLQNFPVDLNCIARTEFWNAWCKKYLENVTSTTDKRARKRNRTHPRAPEGIRETDVLFGRGRTVQEHVGNVLFRGFLQERAEEYDTLPRNQRIEARIRYTQELISSGTRFLRQNESKIWVACDFGEAVDKVSQYFRTRRSINNRQRETGV